MLDSWLGYSSENRISNTDTRIPELDFRNSNKSGTRTPKFEHWYSNTVTWIPKIEFRKSNSENRIPKLEFRNSNSETRILIFFYFFQVLQSISLRMTIDSHCTELNKNWERKFVPSPRWLTSPYTWQNSKSRKHITTKMKIKSKNTNQNASRPSVHFSEKLPSFAYNKQKKNN